ncbi:MAG TPA: VCBS repeat-containing protein, partial [Microthrixaceae bacterium]|nr:VCBS repeat-containing protein [Microthrixaceae bacterium]
MLHLLLAAALAQEGSIFGGLAYPGDGQTPSYREHLEVLRPPTTSPASLVQAGDGAATVSIPVVGPPALLAPTVALTWSPEASAASPIAPGWALDVGYRLQRASAAAEARRWEGREVYQLALPGVTATLVEDGAGGWEVLSREPVGLAVAREGDTFRVVSQGVTAWFEPRLLTSLRFEPAAEPRSWRPVVVVDGSCNAIRFRYDLSDRLVEVLYGGNLRRGHDCPVDLRDLDPRPEDPHTGRLELVWEGAADRQIWTEGVREPMDGHLDEIRAWSRSEGAAWRPFQDLVLRRGEVDGREVIDGYDRRGSDGAMQAGATYTWSGWDGEVWSTAMWDPITEEEEPFGGRHPDWYWRGSSYTHRQSWGNFAAYDGEAVQPAGMAVTLRLAAVQDLTGDGLVDLAHHDDQRGLLVQIHDPGHVLSGLGARPFGAPLPIAPFDDRVFHSTQRGIDDIQRRHGLDTDEVALEIRESVDLSPGWSATVTRRLLVDLNGDGRPDLLESTEPAPAFAHDGWEPDPIGPLRALPTDWVVRLGQAGPGPGFEAPQRLTGPLGWPQVTLTPTRCDPGPPPPRPDQPGVGDWREASAAWNTYNPHLVDLRDVNGDGLPDVVYLPGRADPEAPDLQAPPLAWLALPDTDGFAGWSDAPIALEGPAALLNGEGWVRRVLDPEWRRAWDVQLGGQASPSEQAYPSCSWTETWQARDLVDLTGDGLVDLVVQADPSATYGPWVWAIYPGNTRGWSSSPVLWSAPTRWLGVTHESTRRTTVEQLVFINPPDANLFDDCTSGAPDRLPFLGQTDPGGDPSGGMITDQPAPPSFWSSGPIDFHCVIDALGAGVHVQGDLGAATTSQPMGLLDVDGDGLPDVVSAGEGQGPPEVRWYRNTGAGFSDEQCAAHGGPGVCPEEAVLHQGLARGRADLPGSVIEVPIWHDDARQLDWMSSAVRYRDESVVMDLNADGRPDRLDLVEGRIVYSPARRPGQLIGVSNGRGGHTDLAWVPASDLHPRGLATEPQPSASTRFVLDRTETSDAVTGARSRTRYAYDTEHCGVTGCVGFEWITASVEIPRLELAPDLGRLEPWRQGGEIVWFPLQVTRSRYEVQRDAAWLRDETQWVDHHLAVSPLFGQTDVLSAPRYTLIQAYVDAVSGATAADGVPECDWSPQGPRRCRLADQRVTTVAEEGQPGMGWGERDRLVGTVTTEIHWDDQGWPEALSRYADPAGWDPQPEPGGASSAEGVVELSWSWAQNPARGTVLPSARLTTGYDHVLAAATTLEVQGWAYDSQGVGGTPGRGLLTGQIVCGDRREEAGCFDPILWYFDRSDRGGIAGVDGPKGSDREVLAWRFGGTVAGVEDDALGHRTRRRVDDRGLVVWEADPNGVVRRWEHDGFGRVTHAYVRGVGGREWLTERTTYVDARWTGSGWEPGYTRVERFDLHNQGGPSDDVRYEVRDGFDHVRQTWRSDDAGAFVVADRLTDL